MTRKRRPGDDDEDAEFTIDFEESVSEKRPATLGQASAEEPELSFGLEESDDGAAPVINVDVDTEVMEVMAMSPTETGEDTGSEEEITAFGGRPPRYDLLLNQAGPRAFPECPRCSAATASVSLDIFAMSEEQGPLLFSHSGPLCPSCELFIVHAVELEVPEAILEGVQFIGSIEADFARSCEQEPRPLEEILEHLADFRSTTVIRDRGAEPR